MNIKNFILSVPEKVNEKMDKLRVADAMTEVFTIFKRCNKYIDETMPWALAKDEEKKDRLATVLYNLVEGICIGATLLKSFTLAVEVPASRATSAIVTRCFATATPSDR